MKHGSNPRRGRPRGNGKRNPSQRGGGFESGGSESKVRGTAQQVQDKYLVLAREALSAGDRIAAESYFQHAEHYFRVLHPVSESRGQAGQGRGHPGADRKPPVQEGGEEATKKTAAKAPEDEPQPAGSEPEPVSA